MPVEQQWQIGKWNGAHGWGWRTRYTYIYFARTRRNEIDGNNENFLTFWYRQTRFPPPRGIFRIVLFSPGGGWKKYILNFPSGSKTARSYEISLKLYVERRVWRDEREMREGKRGRKKRGTQRNVYSCYSDLKKMKQNGTNARGQ